MGGLPRRRARRRKFLWLQAERKPKLALVPIPRVERKLEIAGHHADHGVRLAVKKDLAPQYIRISVEAAPPHAIAQHRHLLAFFVFLLCERAPQQWWHSQRSTDFAAHPRRIHRRRFARAR